MSFGLLTAIDITDLPRLFIRLAANYRGTIDANQARWHSRGDRQGEVWAHAAALLEHSAAELEAQIATIPKPRERIEKAISKPQRGRERIER